MIFDLYALQGVFVYYIDALRASGESTRCRHQLAHLEGWVNFWKVWSRWFCDCWLLEENVCVVVHNSCGHSTQNRNRFEAMLPDQGVSVYMSRTLPCIMVFLFGTGWYVTWSVKERSLWCAGEAMNFSFGGKVFFKMTKKWQMTN